MIANDNFDVRVLQSAVADGSTSTAFIWDTGRVGGGNSFRDSNGADAILRRICNYSTFSLTASNWTYATKYLTGPFTNYHFNHGDIVVLTAGTGLVAGPYEIAAKIDNGTVQLVSTADLDGGGGDIADSSIVGTAYMGTDFKDAFVPARTFDEAGFIQCDVWGALTGAGTVVVTGGTYAEGAPSTLTKTGAFTTYTYTTGDMVLVTSGTGARIGLYPVGGQSGGSADTIQLAASIGDAADGQTDIAFTVLKAVGAFFTPWFANADGSGATKVDAVAGNWTIPYMVGSALSTSQFWLTIRIALSRGQELSTNAVIDYQMRGSTAVTVAPSTWSTSHISRSTQEFKLKDRRFYLTYGKSASTANLAVTPKGIMWTHWAPKVLG